MKRTFILMVMALALANAACAQTLEKVRLGVLLPFSGNSSRTPKMVEFYRGVLMAVDSVAAEGVSVDVTALDCGTSVDEMSSLIAAHGETLGRCDVIIGPQAGAQVPALSAFCRTRGVRLVVPFSDVTSQAASENVFVVSTNDKERESQARYLGEKLFTGQRVVRLKDADEIDVSAIDTLAHNVVLCDARTLPALNRLMAALDGVTGEHQQCQVTLVGTYEWQAFMQQHLHNFYKYDTYVPVTYFRNALSPMSVAFENRYIRQFGAQMIASAPRFAPMGFDIAYFFLQGLAHYGSEGTLFEENLGAMYNRQHAYQHSLFFEWDGTGCWMNRSCRFVHYTADGRVELLSR